MDTDETKDIEDAEVVEDTPQEEAVGDTSSPVQSRLNMETMINRYVGDLEKLKEQMKEQKDMFNDAFRNDPEYKKQDDLVKEATRVRTGIKQRILKQPAMAELQSKINYIKDQINDTQDALSGYLQQYYQSTGTNQITSDDGEIREIVIVTKLVKKSSKYRP